MRRNRAYTLCAVALLLALQSTAGAENLQSQDELVYEDKAHPQRFISVDTTEDERFVFLSVPDESKGTRGSALFYQEATKGDKAFRSNIADIGDDEFRVVRNLESKFLIRTNRNAPNRRVFLYDPADHDDRVVPAHSFKYAATLQEKAGNGDNPIVVRIETRSGHGASSSTKTLETTADIYTFIFYDLGITPGC